MQYVNEWEVKIFNYANFLFLIVTVSRLRIWPKYVFDQFHCVLTTNAKRSIWPSKQFSDYERDVLTKHTAFRLRTWTNMSLTKHTVFRLRTWRFDQAHRVQTTNVKNYVFDQASSFQTTLKTISCLCYTLYSSLVLNTIHLNLF